MRDRASEIEIHPDFLAIWHRALADIVQMERSFVGFAYVDVADDEVIKKPGDGYQLKSSVAGKSVILDVPQQFWRYRDNDNQPWGEIQIRGMDFGTLRGIA